MYQIYRSSLVVLCVIVDVCVFGQFCIYKECICADTAIICAARGLTSIPPSVLPAGSYTTINLAALFSSSLMMVSFFHLKERKQMDNAITDLPEESFPPNLEGIYLQDNPITTIADAAFDGSDTTLEALYFSSALFKRIPDAFRHLKSLQQLNMQDLNIQDWNDEAMKNIGQTLITLSLDNVGFTAWPNWLQYFSNLTELTISTSSISSIPDNAFDNMVTTLNILTISNNKFTEVPKALSNLEVLQQLYIQQNRIVDVSWLPSKSPLRTLTLRNNLISDAKILSNAVLPYSESLSEFDIVTNRLPAIPNIAFLQNVNSLDFSSNRISDPYSGTVASNVQSIEFSNNLLPAIPRILATLQSVPQLYLSSNSITQIQASDFPASAQIVDLDINLITELRDNSFPVGSNIKNLNLNHNPIVKISNLAFKNLVHLTELDLQNSRLLRLPLAFSSLTSLKSLDMTNTANLVCTCQEKSLESWVLSMPHIYVLGNCGLMGIYEFFSKISPYCPP